MSGQGKERSAVAAKESSRGSLSGGSRVLLCFAAESVYGGSESRQVSATGGTASLNNKGHGPASSVVAL